MLYQDHDAVTALRREAAELFLNSEGATPASLRVHDRTLDVPSQSSDLHPLPNPTPHAHVEFEAQPATYDSLRRGVRRRPRERGKSDRHGTHDT